jgi:hypothetical protein
MRTIDGFTPRIQAGGDVCRGGNVDQASASGTDSGVPAHWALATAAVAAGLVDLTVRTVSYIQSRNPSYEREGSAIHWISHVVADITFPFLAVAVYLLWRTHRERLPWWGRAGAMLAIAGAVASSLTGLAILISHGDGPLYAVAHTAESVSAIVFVGLLGLLVAMARYASAPKGWILLILIGMPTAFVLASVLFLVVDHVWIYMPAWYLFGIAWVWLGLLAATHQYRPASAGD